MRREETERDGRVRTLRVRAASLEIVDGPDRGLTVRLDAPDTVVGSGEGADVFLSDPTVSRRHVHLTLTTEGLRLRDADSRNGTWLGPVRMQQALIVTDVSVTLGSTVIAIKLDAQPSDIPLHPEPNFGSALGGSDAMRYMFARLDQAAGSEVTVLLEGESGTGKELLARAIHERSPRAAGPFLPVDCGAIPPHMIESELFGHVRGAFTGASKARTGLFEMANGGTIFLDEIGELPLEQQTRLLRVLETREIRPLGSNLAQRVDVRVVAATHRRLEDQVRSGAFRQDLFFRLAVVRARVPPLRDRLGDVLMLATAFLREITGKPHAELPPDLAGMLVVYHWPGNVRELRNVVQRYAVFGDQNLFTDSAVSGSQEAAAGWFDGLEDLTFLDARRLVLERFERIYLPRVLAREKGVVAYAAARAGVARQSFHRMMKRLGIEADE
jgi:two-component system response regulator GlrR